MRPDADRDPLDCTELAFRLAVSASRIARRTRITGGSAIPPLQLDTLIRLHAEGPMNLSVLADREAVNISTMSRVITKLVRHGLVHRTIEPRDARVARLEVSQDGAVLIDEHRSGASRWIAKRIRRMNSDDRASIAAIAHLIESMLDDGDCGPHVSGNQGAGPMTHDAECTSDPVHDRTPRHRSTANRSEKARTNSYHTAEVVLARAR